VRKPVGVARLERRRGATRARPLAAPGRAVGNRGTGPRRGRLLSRGLRRRLAARSWARAGRCAARVLARCRDGAGDRALDDPQPACDGKPDPALDGRRLRPLQYAFSGSRWHAEGPPHGLPRGDLSGADPSATARAGGGACEGADALRPRVCVEPSVAGAAPRTGPAVPPLPARPRRVRLPGRVHAWTAGAARQRGARRAVEEPPVAACERLLLHGGSDRLGGVRLLLVTGLAAGVGASAHDRLLPRRGRVRREGYRRRSRRSPA